jgi:hypothetical protein
MHKSNPPSLLLAVVFASLTLLTISLVSCSGSLPVRTPEIQPSAACPQLDPHPIGESITEKFDVPYEEVMDWFCKGETFEDILLALETQELTGRTLEELFAMKHQKSWENVWKELGIVP